MRFISIHDIGDEIKKMQQNLKPAINVSRYNSLTGNYQLLLSTKVDIQAHHKDKLQAMGINEICIEDPLTDDIEINEPLSEDNVLKFGHNLDLIRSLVHPISVELAKKKLNADHFNDAYRKEVYQVLLRSPELKKLNSVMRELFDEFMVNFRNFKPYPFAKPINSLNFVTYHGMFSAIVAAKIVMKMGAKVEGIWNIFGGLALQDIGVAPKYYLKEKNTPIEEKNFKTHPKIGCLIVNESPYFNPMMGISILNHHRYMNRSGFPRSLKVKTLYNYKKGIHEFGRVSSIVNSFCLLSLFYPAQPALDSVSEIFNDYLYDKRISEVLKNSIKPYGVGSILRLKEDEKVMVKEYTEDEKYLILRVIEDNAGKRLKEKKDIKISVRDKRIKGPWFVDEILKKKESKHQPSIVISFLENIDKIRGY